MRRDLWDNLLYVRHDKDKEECDTQGRVARSQTAGQGRGIRLDVLTQHLTALAEAMGQRMAGTKTEVGAKILMHALDDNSDRRLQKEELREFALDVLRRVSDN